MEIDALLDVELIYWLLNGLYMTYANDMERAKE